MATISQNDLRKRLGEILRRAEAGEEFTIIVAGRPVATLGPTPPRRWVGGRDLAAVWATEPPRALDEDPAVFGGALSDPFARRTR